MGMGKYCNGLRISSHFALLLAEQELLSECKDSKKEDRGVKIGRHRVGVLLFSDKLQVIQS
jgi:hypothetical protein